MKLYLQFGYGMMGHCKELIEKWGEGTVILSPRDLDTSQLVSFASEITESQGKVLLDPQVYLPQQYHAKLQLHDYFPKSYISNLFWSGQDVSDLIKPLLGLNNELKCSEFILPGLFANTVNADWLYRQKVLAEEASNLNKTDMSLIATVALSAGAVSSQEQIHTILDKVDDWPVSGVYLVCEHPDSNYLVSNPSWLANVLDLVAGLRLSGKQVIIGYCSHQMLIAACASATAIASGTWMNVRMFIQEKFIEDLEKSDMRKSVWYYCPQALSEYQINFLDIAKTQGVLNLMKAPSFCHSSYADALFSAPQPTSAPFKERQALRHYLTCLFSQVLNARQATYNDTMNAHKQLLDNAEFLLNTLHKFSIVGKKRDFMESLDANRAALGALDTTYGPQLRRYWSNL